MRKIILFIMLIFNILCYGLGRPPVPDGHPGGFHPGPELRDPNDHHMAGPVGTATCLLVVLGAGYTIYKIKKNNNDN